MNDLIDLVLAFSRRGAAPGGRATPRLIWLAGLGLCAVVCGIGAVACALVAIWLSTAIRLGAIGATLMVAGILLIGCLGFVALVRRQPPSHVVPEANDLMPALVVAETLRLIRAHRGTVLIAAVLAGLALARTEK